MTDIKRLTENSLLSPSTLTKDLVSWKSTADKLCGRIAHDDDDDDISSYIILCESKVPYLQTDIPVAFSSKGTSTISICSVLSAPDMCCTCGLPATRTFVLGFALPGKLVSQFR